MGEEGDKNCINKTRNWLFDLKWRDVSAIYAVYPLSWIVGYKRNSLEFEV